MTRVAGAVTPLTMERIHQSDLAIVGGGLAGGLIVLALAQRRPEARVLRIERHEHLGGGDIWFFLESDIAPDDRAPLVLLVAHWWDGCDAILTGRRAIGGGSRSVVLADSAAPAFHDTLHPFARAVWRERRFYHLYNWIQVHGAWPAEHHRPLDRLYRLDESLIGRFYAGCLTARDKTRIVAGRPPVPIGWALRVAAGVRGRV